MAYLGGIADVINGLKLTAGKGISITTASDGWIINALSPGQASATTPTDPGTTPSSGGSSGGSNPDGGGWMSLNVMDASCNKQVIWVWARTDGP